MVPYLVCILGGGGCKKKKNSVMLLCFYILTPGKHVFFSTLQMKCPMSIRVRCKDDETLEITNIVHEHNYEVSKAAFNHLFHQSNLDSGQKNEIA